MDHALNHWSQHARQWQAIGPPLRPDVEDIHLLETRVTPPLKTLPHRPVRVLLLGVTPEIVSLDWPDGVQLIALDCCPDMVTHVWPMGAAPKGAYPICGDWRQIPLPDGACDLVIGDGCFTLLDYPQGYHQVLQAIRRVLKPQGYLAMRFFLRPAIPEPLATIFTDLWAGRIGNFHIFKWRLAMALHGPLTTGVRLTDIWQVWRQAGVTPDHLAQHLDWPVQAIATINAYRGITNHYTFPTLAEVDQTFSQSFEQMTCHFPAYELGDRCPTLLFRPV